MTIKHFSSLFAITLFLFTNILSAQSNEVLLTNSKKINTKRYEEIKGSPYILKEWLPGSILSNEQELTTVEALNYNAHTSTFEIKQEGRFIELDPTWYTQIVLNAESEAPLTFRKVSHPSFDGQFMQILYEGEGRLFKQSESKISKKTFNNVGKTIHVEQFVDRTTYHWIKDATIQSFKRSKKSIVKTLGQKKVIDSFLKKNKLKLNSDEHLTQLIAHLDSTSR